MLVPGPNGALVECLVGCRLKRMLGWAWIRSDDTCKCDARAAQMDAWGPDECERQIDVIVGWLREEAERRFPLVPFLDAPVRVLVHQAIAAARRESHARETEASGRGAADVGQPERG